jgi:multidrug efflux pump subunit AcrB
MRFIHLAVKNPLVINLLTILIIILGAMFALDMRREAFPSINFNYVVVSAVYPGASPEEVELYVVNPIEAEMATVDGIEELIGSALESRGAVTAKLDQDASNVEVKKVTDEIIRAVNRVSDLPDDLLDLPIVTEIKSDRVPIIELALNSDSLSDLDLKDHAENLIRKIETLEDVSSVDYMSERKREYWVEIDPKKLRYYDMSLTEVIGALRARNISLPAGNLQLPDGEYLVRTIGSVKEEKEIAQTIVRSNASQKIRVKDIGSVKHTLEEAQILHRANGENALLLQVKKSKRGDVIRLVDKVKKLVGEYQSAPGGKEFKIAYINDFSMFVRNRLGVLVNNGIAGIIFVSLILLFMLSPGIAAVTSVGMPIAFIGGFIFMGYADMTINLLTMFGMIIVLGILVDDAIIVGENIYYYYEQGYTPYEATIKGTEEVFVPVSATIATTIAAFSPLMLMSGVMGKFIAEMPKVVIATLVSSWFEAMFILPSHAYDMLRLREWRTGKKNKGVSRDPSTLKAEAKAEPIAEPATKLKPRKKHRIPVISSFGSMAISSYEAFLKIVLQYRYVFILVFLGFCGLTGLHVHKNMKVVLFPPNGIEQFMLRIDLPTGSTLAETGEEILRMEQLIAALPDSELEDYVTTLGVQQDDPNDPLSERGKHLGEIRVYLTPDRYRDRDANVIVQDIRNGAQKLAEGTRIERVTIEKVKGGPPTGKPISIRVSVDNFDEAKEIAQKISSELAGYEGVFDIVDSMRGGKREIVVEVDEAKAAASLLTVEMVAANLRAALDGAIASYVRTSTERQALRVRLKSENRRGMVSIRDLSIQNKAGQSIPLKAIASFKQGEGLSKISHLDRRRRVSIVADVDTDVITSVEVNNKISPMLDELKRERPYIDIEQGGEFEDTKDSMESLQKAFLGAAGFIFLILATLFGNLSQPIVVMSAIPFGIVGVVWSLFFHGMPLSFLAMIGTIGLSGVVVNDSIVLVDFLNRAKSKGKSSFDAAVEAGLRRFRPVWLTTLTTVAGLVPMVYGIGGTDKFLQPAAVALGYGLLFGTVLILLLIPALCMIRDDIVGLAARTPSKNPSSQQ